MRPLNRAGRRYVVSGDKSIGRRCANGFNNGVWKPNGGWLTARQAMPREVAIGRNRALSPNVPAGQNMNSRGLQPTVSEKNTFDPAG